MIIPVVCYNPIVLLLQNNKTKRWHPIIYWECPLPSEKIGEGYLRRWKSKSHHTEGFKTKDEAINSSEGGVINVCKRMVTILEGGNIYYDIKRFKKWDDKGIPASVMFFNLNQLTKYES